MEPIDFIGGLRRGWRLLVVLALVGAVIAVLVPVGSKPKKKVPLPFEAVAIVGSAPAGGSNAVGGSVTSSQIQFYASLSSTQQLAATLAGLKAPSFVLGEYLSAVIGPVALGPGSATSTTLAGKGKKNLSPLVSLLARGKTIIDAVDLANAYSAAVGHVIQVDADSRAQAAAASKASASSSAASAKGTGSKGTGSKVTATTTPPPSATGSTPPSVDTGYQVESPASYAYRTNKHAVSLSASRKVRAVAGFVIGLLLAVAIILIRELLDKRVRNRSRAEANFGFPVVVEIPTGAPVGAASARGPTQVVDVVRDPDSAGAEAYRMLRMSVLFEPLAADSGPIDPYGLAYAGYGSAQPNGNGRAPSAGRSQARAVPEVGSIESLETLPEHVGNERQVILVVSAGVEPSRPHVAANLAAIYAEAGQRVIVMSTGDIVTVGPAEQAYRHGDVSAEEVRAALEPSRLELVSRLPLRPFIGTSGQLVTRAPMVLRAARRLADAVIVEVPPLLALHHAEAMAHAADLVLVVGECGWTTFPDARAAGELLRRIDAPVLGVVLTNVRIGERDIRRTVAARPAAADAMDGEHLALRPGSEPSSPPTTISPT